VERAVGFPNGFRSLLGVNNRDLKVQQTDLGTTERLAARVGEGALLVSESGIRMRDDVRRLIAAGARALLIGETFMRATDIGEEIEQVLGPAD
jgi:indole-3-glycerol phosphate synthase